jgi:hypothetical protein
MKKLIVLTCVLLTAAQAIYAQPKPTLHQKDLFRGRLDSKQRCTIIYASDGKTALAGNNEDYKSPCRLKKGNSEESILGGKRMVSISPKEA